MRRGSAYDIIEDECQRNDARWGADRTQDWGMWSMILGEEVGELQQAMYNHIERHHLGVAVQRGDLTCILAEAMQVAAVAVEVMRDAARRLEKLNGPRDGEAAGADASVPGRGADDHVHHPDEELRDLGEAHRAGHA